MDDYFVADFKREAVIGQTIKRRLKCGTVPTLFSFAPQHKSRRTSKRWAEQQRIKEEKDEVISMFYTYYTPMYWHLIDFCLEVVTYKMLYILQASSVISLTDAITSSVNHVEVQHELWQLSKSQTKKSSQP